MRPPPRAPTSHAGRGDLSPSSGCLDVEGERLGWAAGERLVVAPGAGEPCVDDPSSLVFDSDSTRSYRLAKMASRECSAVDKSGEVGEPMAI